MLQSALAPFGDERSAATYGGAMLFAGSNATNYTVGCFGEVLDSLGAAGLDTTVVRVRNKPMSFAALQNISEVMAREKLESNDADGPRQVLVATLQSMESSGQASGAASGGGGGGRRRLAGSGDEDAAALLSSVLAYLWADARSSPPRSC